MDSFPREKGEAFGILRQQLLVHEAGLPVGAACHLVEIFVESGISQKPGNVGEVSVRRFTDCTALAVLLSSRLLNWAIVDSNREWHSADFSPHPEHRWAVSGVGSSNAQSTVGSARALDALLQEYAYKAFYRPRTGISYDGDVPSNLTGIKVSAMRLRSGSLRNRGVAAYKEFEIPTGVTETSYVERLVLVYQNLGNWSVLFYPSPGYTYLSPVLGLLAYDAFNLSATNLPELDIRASADPILIHFTDVKSPPLGSVARCVSFGINGSINFSNLTSSNVCSTMEQGHFSIVVESIAPSPAPAAPISPPPTSGGGGPSPGKASHGKSNTVVWIIVGSVVGGIALIGLLGLLVLWTQKFKQRKNMQQMEKAAEAGETLHMTSVGDTKAPAAMVTRTQPILESEYVP
ncbi:hypothetical protein NL676_001252 [Syzygium grande]|nr:hypothetical protein NL676_001252 [Syzygium grande]